MPPSNISLHDDSDHDDVSIGESVYDTKSDADNDSVGCFIYEDNDGNVHSKFPPPVCSWKDVGHEKEPGVQIDGARSYIFDQAKKEVNHYRSLFKSDVSDVDVATFIYGKDSHIWNAFKVLKWSFELYLKFLVLFFLCSEIGMNYKDIYSHNLINLTAYLKVLPKILDFFGRCIE